MSEFEAEVKKAEQELEQSLVPVVPERSESGILDDEFLGDLKMQAQEYGQRLQDLDLTAVPNKSSAMRESRWPARAWGLTRALLFKAKSHWEYGLTI